MEEDRLSKIESKVARVEDQVQELANQISKISEIVSDILSWRDAESKLYASDFPTENANAWTLQTALDLRAALADELFSDKFMIPSSGAFRETYRRTLAVLATEEEGCTAEEVGKRTGRSRNTESEYLHRLYLDGILRKVRQGKKTKYLLVDTGLSNSSIGK